MSNKRWTTGYHLIRRPKYRRKALVDRVEVRLRLRELPAEKASEIDVTIETMEIMPDHVHLFIKSTPVNSPHYIVRQFKCYTSGVLGQEFAGLRSWLPTIWTRSYYVESVGHISEATVKQDIANRKNK